jgi:hypothetical protein
MQKNKRNIYIYIYVNVVYLKNKNNKYKGTEAAGATGELGQEVSCPCSVLLVASLLVENKALLVCCELFIIALKINSVLASK